MRNDNLKSLNIIKELKSASQALDGGSIPLTRSKSLNAIDSALNLAPIFWHDLAHGAARDGHATRLRRLNLLAARFSASKPKPYAFRGCPVLFCPLITVLSQAGPLTAITAMV
jgi:hypothetical protein